MYLNPFGMSSSCMAKQKLLGFVAVLGFLSMQAQAEEKPHGRLWRVSAAILGAVTIADMHSSVGRLEAHPFLRSPDGRFAARGVALKGIGVGAAIGAQWLLLRRNPRAAPYAAGANLALSALTGAAVVHNHMLK